MDEKCYKQKADTKPFVINIITHKKTQKNTQRDMPYMKSVYSLNCTHDLSKSISKATQESMEMYLDSTENYEYLIDNGSSVSDGSDDDNFSDIVLDTNNVNLD